MKRLMPLFVAAFLGSVMTFGLYYVFIKPDKKTVLNYENSNNVRFASNTAEAEMPSFRNAAKKSIESVVHIKSTAIVNTTSYEYYQYTDPFEQFFGGGSGNFYYKKPKNNQQKQESSGSGVIVSKDGYVVTNNHVVNGADELEVILNDNRKFNAKLIGTDPTTDLALLKIDANDLPNISFGNSDDVFIGDFVLAVGNPFNLSSTVTAGIISAKARNIDILKEDGAIESFLQTDAAVNPGNSGGALVNLDGNLIGINTAIATPTGVFAGYSFAVPSNIVSRVVDDLINFGNVQRAYLGVNIRDVDNDLAKELNMSSPKGVYIDQVLPQSAAKDAGLQEKDIIVKLNDQPVDNRSELLGQIGQYRPGDKVKISYIRDGTTYETSLTLKNIDGNTTMTKADPNAFENSLGVVIEPLNVSEKRALRMNNGLKVMKINPDGKFAQGTQIQQGYIITKIDNKPVSTKEEFVEILKKKKGAVMLEGMYPNYFGKYYYALNIK